MAVQTSGKVFLQQVGSVRKGGFFDLYKAQEY